MAGKKKNEDQNEPKIQASKKNIEQKKKINNEDRRSQGERVPVQLLVDYKSHGHYLFDFCSDLGVGGIFIQTTHPKKQGSRLALTFTLPDSKETLSTEGQVIWVQEPIAGRADLPSGMGIQFEDFSVEQRELLDKFVKRYQSERLSQNVEPA